jgi:hypothetical protein
MSTTNETSQSQATSNPSGTNAPPPPRKSNRLPLVLAGCAIGCVGLVCVAALAVFGFAAITGQGLSGILSATPTVSSFPGTALPVPGSITSVPVQLPTLPPVQLPTTSPVTRPTIARTPTPAVRLPTPAVRTPTSAPRAGNCPPVPPPDLAPSGYVDTVTMAEDTRGDLKEPVNPTTVFKTSSVFHAVVAIADAPDDTKFGAVWYAVDVGNAAPCNSLIDQTELNSGGSRNIDFHLTPTNKWPVGTYRVEIYVNDDLDTVVNFSVK